MASGGLSDAARALVKRHSLEPHPEGGFYRQTWASSVTVQAPWGQRSAGTAILFLITPGRASRLHRIRSDEAWHFYSGGPMTVVELDEKAPGQVRLTVLGPDASRGHKQQYVVKANTWFGSFCNEGSDHSFVGCTVSPGFHWKDFELATGALASALARAFPKAAPMLLSKGLLDPTSKL